MARAFKELRNKVTPESKQRASVRVRELLQEMLLSELRVLSGRTQTELASELGIKQPTLSKLESQDDMQISTRQRIVEVLGGELEIIAKMPAGQVSLSQFRDPASRRSA